jgi:hypothetical protein
MADPTTTEINAWGDVDFDQDIDTETVAASSRGIAIDGDVDDSAFNSGTNTGIVAGDDVDLDDSIVGNGNTQINDSTVGAFAAHGSATNAQGGNVLLGSGDLVDIDSEGDAQAVTGNGNDVMGDVDVDLDDTDGPVNLAFGDGNHQNALEDNSTTYEDSFNEDHSIEDSYNTAYDDSFNTVSEDNDTTSIEYDDSFNSHYEDNDTSSYDWASESSYESSYEDNDSYQADVDMDDNAVDIWGDENDVDLDA